MAHWQGLGVRGQRSVGGIKIENTDQVTGFLKVQRRNL